MARKKKHEEHVNAEAWAIPYGDLITLLLAFFVVMYSMSSVNQGKYRILSDSLIAAFRGAPSTLSPINIGEKATGKGGDTNLSGVSPTALMKLRDPRPVPEAEEEKEGGAGGRSKYDFSDPRQALEYMAAEVREALKTLIESDQVRVRQSALTLEVEIKTDILFASGVANVDSQAVPVIEKIAEILKPFPNAVRVEGHTDDRPISTALFPSNWELSAARAANVVQLFTRAGVGPQRMEVLGLGEQRPVASNATPEGRNANRRVVIVVLQTPDGAVPQVADSVVAGTARAPAPAVGVAATPAAATPAAAAPGTAGGPLQTAVPPATVLTPAAAPP